MMANEEKKDFNAMLHKDTGMPKIQVVTDEATVQKYGGEKMFFAPPFAYDEVMKTVPYGKVLTIGAIRDYFAKQNHADFTDPVTAGIFVSIAAWASAQRKDNETPYWRILKGAKGEAGSGGPHGYPPGPDEFPVLCKGIREGAFPSGIRKRIAARSAKHTCTNKISLPAVAAERGIFVRPYSRGASRSFSSFFAQSGHNPSNRTLCVCTV